MKKFSAISILVFGIVLPVCSATLSDNIAVNNLAAYTGNSLNYDISIPSRCYGLTQPIVMSLYRLHI